jgi:hypothetical protein
MGSGPCGDGDLLVGRGRGGSDCGPEDVSTALQAVEAGLGKGTKGWAGNKGMCAGRLRC